MSFGDSGWSYSDWQSQSTFSARRTRLILHIQEVTDYLTARTSGGGQAYDPTVLQLYVKDLQEVLRKDYGGAGFDENHPAVKAGFVRGVPKA